MSLINGSALIVTGISEVGGSIALTDTANPLTITGISDTAPNGNISVTNSGALTTTGAVTTAPNGNISLVSTGTQTINAAVSAGGSGIVTVDATGSSSNLLVNAVVSSVSGNINAWAGGGGPINGLSGGAVLTSPSGSFRTTGMLSTSISLGYAFLLNPSISTALNVSGNVVLNISNRLEVDSNSATAIKASGSTASISAYRINVVGGVQTTGNAVVQPSPLTGNVATGNAGASTRVRIRTRLARASSIS